MTDDGTILPDEGRDRALYVARLHDKQIEALIRSKRLGNYLLIGRSGSGKTASLMALSDQLLTEGLEHQLIPCRLDRKFVPPMAKINLVDDLDTFAIANYLDSELIYSLNASGSRSLNIITTRPPEADQLRTVLRIDGEISIASLSEPETLQFYAKYLVQRGGSTNVGVGSGFVELLQNQIRKGQAVYPRALHLIIRGAQGDGRFYYRSNIPESQLEIVRPKLISVRDGILRRITRHPSDLEKLSPTEFENLIGELFEKEGYSVEFTKASRDGGVDIFASKRDLAGESLTIVQCKKHRPDNPVRVGVVREVVGSMNIHNATARRFSRHLTLQSLLQMRQRKFHTVCP